MFLHFADFCESAYCFQWRIQDFREGVPTPRGADLLIDIIFAEKSINMNKIAQGWERQGIPWTGWIVCAGSTNSFFAEVACAKSAEAATAREPDNTWFSCM